MKTKYKVWLGVLLACAIVAVSGWYLHRHTIAVLQPAGEIGTKERNLIIFGASLSLAIVLPVFGLLAYFAYKYRESNPRARYTPEVGGNKGAEFIWWLVPSVLIVIISIVTWQSSFALDPYKPIASTKQAVQVQVVALDWKWLFIYPQQHVASVNEVAMPVGTPVDFEITSDTVMNSFWIPQLGGQMYAMPGMSTQLNLLASKPGDYRGQSANISGKGFAGMVLTAKAMNQSGFDDWIAKAEAAPTKLTAGTYAQLAKASVDNPVRYYSSASPNLYTSINAKYMSPISSGSTMNSNMAMPGMSM